MTGNEKIKFLSTCGFYLGSQLSSPLVTITHIDNNNTENSSNSPTITTITPPAMDPETARALAEEGLDDGGFHAGGSGSGGGGGGGDMASRRSGRSIKRKKFDDELVDSMSTSYPKPLKPPSTDQDLLMEGVMEGGGGAGGVGNDHHPLLHHHLENGGPLDHSTATPPATYDAIDVCWGWRRSSGIYAGRLSSAVFSISLRFTAIPLVIIACQWLPLNPRSKKKSGAGGGGKQGNQAASAATAAAAGAPPNGPRYGLPENNYWKPADDLALIINVEQTCDLVKVHQGVRFSIKFSLADLEARWNALLYDVQAKNLSLAGIRQLHPEVVKAVESRALFSEAEEALLRKVESRSLPKLEDFHALITGDNARVFLASRTAKLLRKHWLLLRHYQLLEDQTPVPLPRHESVVSFSEIERIVEQELEVEAMMRRRHPSSTATSATPTASAGASTSHHHQSQSSTPHTPGREDLGLPWPSPQTPNSAAPPPPPSSNNEAAHQEILSSFRKSMLEVRMLENEIPKYQFLLDSFTGVTPCDFADQNTKNNTFAVLRGRLVRYLMRSREVTIGRSTKDFIVDVDLSLEGPSSKISRMQAIIRLEPTGEFNLFNAGKRPIFVDGKPLLTGAAARVNNNSLVEFSTLKFIFLINQDLVSTMRNEELLKA
ncbi:Microspherule protein 1 [Tyrophagus putrescentiae]|nr:Microspherule protein 1 [Tyrophagus putrescentiae]